MANDTGYLVRNAAQPEDPPQLEVFYPTTTAGAVKLSQDPLDPRTLADLEAQVQEIAENFAAGCREIAAALTSMGVDTAADVPLHDMAARIRIIRTPLSGNAAPADVLQGCQFYSTDPDHKQAGTMADWRQLRTPVKGARLHDGCLEIVPAAGCHGADYNSCLYIKQGQLAGLIGLTADRLKTGHSVLGIAGTVDPEAIYQAGYDAGVIDTKKLFCIIECAETVTRLELTDPLLLRPYTDTCLVTMPPQQPCTLTESVRQILLQDELTIREL